MRQFKQKDPQSTIYKEKWRLKSEEQRLTTKTFNKERGAKLNERLDAFFIYQHFFNIIFILFLPLCGSPYACPCYTSGRTPNHTGGRRTVSFRSGTSSVSSPCSGPWTLSRTHDTFSVHSVDGWGVWYWLDPPRSCPGYREQVQHWVRHLHLHHPHHENLVSDCKYKK